MNILQKFEAKELAKIQAEKQVPDFSPGDTLKVNVKVVEGTRERIQAYEGVCIARSGSGINQNFCVRKITLGEGVERVFPLWSSRVDSIEVVRRGSVRRAKLYYLRDRRGKSARIAERTDGHGIEAREEYTESKTARRKAKKAEANAKREAARKEQEAILKAKEDAKKAEEAAKAAEAKAAADAAAAETEAPTETATEE